MESQSAAAPAAPAAAPYMRDRFGCCFHNWIAQQHRDLNELLVAVSTDSGDAEKLRSLAGKNIQHFRDYLEVRSQLAQHDAPSFFCPSWCTSFEDSFLWIGGCSDFKRSLSRRPTLAIRLVYSISGSDLEAWLTSGGRRGDDNSNGSGDNLSAISASQLKSINELHMKTARMEEKLSSRMASMQEEIADDPLALIARRRGRVGEESESVERVMKGHALSLARVLTEADEMRLATLREMVEEILTPLQAVEFLVNMKKLHLSIHEWGKRRDSVLGKV
ncbi:protein DOG1-like 1 [Syzygium oleosum]|uniref:protein DOG1-like 1 n=1 Tax=Syzygium oleosum TaxID=219896 RepID=UPI0011D1CB23|nr:protein DOG1-like 1 [Syzygium oleosum]